MCHSGNEGSQSFAARLANLTGIPINRCHDKIAVDRKVDNSIQALAKITNP